MKRLSLLVLSVALLAGSGCCWFPRPFAPCGGGYGAGYGGGCPGGACGSPYGAAQPYQQGAFLPYGAPMTAAAPMDYVVN